jgi:hypothetical protein
MDDVGLTLGERGGLHGQRLNPARDVPGDEAQSSWSAHAAVRVVERRAPG